MRLALKSAKYSRSAASGSCALANFSARVGVQAANLILQLQQHALRSFLADTRQLRQHLDITQLHRKIKGVRLHSRQHAQRQLRANAADGQQQLEQIIILLTQKAIEQNCVLAHCRMHLHLHSRPQGKLRQMCRRHIHAVADAAGRLYKTIIVAKIANTSL